MPSAIQSPADLPSLLKTLQHALSTDPESALPTLSTAKLTLLHTNALLPTPNTPIATLQTARSILETGALISIRVDDTAAFVRYYAQLQPFYDFVADGFSPSADRTKITGLYLLLLLSQGDYASFHTVLEGLVAKEDGEVEGGSLVERDPYIRYPVELERNLMEGSYDQVWKGTMGEGVPSEEFALFSEDFLDTIRREIASCAAASYPSLPIASAKGLFFLDSEGAVVEFAHKNGWSVSKDGRICFPQVEVAGPDAVGEGAERGQGQRETIENMVGYTRDLEMIV